MINPERFTLNGSRLCIEVTAANDFNIAGDFRHHFEVQVTLLQSDKFVTDNGNGTSTMNVTLLFIEDGSFLCNRYVINPHKYEGI